MGSDIDRQQRAYDRIAAAIRYLATHRKAQPGLAELGRHLGLSEAHLQREFTRWAGVSPKRFLQFLTRADARRRLRAQPVFAAAIESGLSGPGRLHDLIVTWEGMTPGEYRRRGAGLCIRYGVHASPFGRCLIATTGRGICKLAFFDTPAELAALERELADDWGAAHRERDDAATASIAAMAFARDRRAPPRPELLLHGSPFQLKVWEALLAIPPGRIASYRQVADRLGRPTAARAVAAAIGRNDIGWLIPCHRVIRSTGEFSGYRWGAERKCAMVAWEAARCARMD